MGWVLSWLLIPAATAGVQVTTCTMGDEGSWAASLFVVTPLACALLAVIWFTRKHHVRTVVLSVPLAAIIPYCLFFVAPFLVQNTVLGENMCAVLDGMPGFNTYGSWTVLRLWAPAQVLLLLGYGLVAALCWRDKIQSFHRLD